MKKPKVITAIGMFYDLEDPSKFISDAAKSLNDNGVFIAQLMCLDSMIKKNDLGNICHEHLEFYSYPSLKYLFEKNGLKIMKLKKTISMVVAIEFSVKKILKNLLIIVKKQA